MLRAGRLALTAMIIHRRTRNCRKTARRLAGGDDDMSVAVGSCPWDLRPTKFTLRTAASKETDGQEAARHWPLPRRGKGDGARVKNGPGCTSEHERVPVRSVGNRRLNDLRRTPDDDNGVRSQRGHNSDITGASETRRRPGRALRHGRSTGPPIKHSPQIKSSRNWIHSWRTAPVEPKSLVVN